MVVTVSAVFAACTDVERTVGAGSKSWYVTDSRRSAEETATSVVDKTEGCEVQDPATQGDTVKTEEASPGQWAVAEQGSVQSTHS